MTTMNAPTFTIADVSWGDVTRATSSFAPIDGSSKIPCLIRLGINVANRTETNMPASTPRIPKNSDNHPSTETPKGRLLAASNPRRLGSCRD